MKVRLQPLNSAIHNRKGFDCGNPQLNHWLATMASQHQQKNISRTFVAVDVSNPTTILGFFSLTVSEVDGSHCPSAKRLPNRVPVVRVGRCAVATDQGKGIGEWLLINALDKVREIAMNAGVVAVVIDAKDEKAASFYEKRDFIRSPEDPLLLILYTATLQQA
jgi:GNAT superfamily N-acetyltransferase